MLRWLLLAIAAILVAACVALRRLRPGSDPSRWNELITAAGVAALTGAAAFDLANYYLQSIFADISGTQPDVTGGAFWDIVLLAVSIALILWSGRAGSRR